MALLLLVAACTSVEKEPAQGPTRELPMAEYKDTTILDMYEGSRLSWVLKTSYLVKWPRSDLVRARPVELTVFDSLRQVAVTVTSDSGSVDEGISFLAAMGHVHARSAKGVDITTDSLRWNKAINRISTEAFVRVISEEGDTLTGRGFLADANMDNWQILGNVKGVFQKVEERFQKADEDTASAGSGTGADATPPAAPPDSTSGTPSPAPAP